jgi:peroxiredoxin
MPKTRLFAKRLLAKRVLAKRVLVAVALIAVLGADATAQSTGQADNRAPAFRLPDASGAIVSLDDFEGHLVVLNFWATWCAPCRHEMPAFVRLQDRYRDDVRFVGISVDVKGWPVITPFVEEIGVNYTILLDRDSAVLERYGDPSALPATFLIDGDGRMQVIIQGMVSESDLDEILQMMLRGEEL